MNEIKTLDIRNSDIKLLNQLETFVLVEGTQHYYISSEGRLANDTKGKIYLHSDSIPQKARKLHWKIYYEDVDGTTAYRDVNADDLVAETFLEKVKGKNKIYHIDGDISNNRYSNLMYVDDKEAYALRNGSITVEDLGREQKYIPFLNTNLMKARRLWNDMNTRCYNAKLHKRYPEYEGCTICDDWLQDKESFFKWVEENYYTVGAEQMDLDKDILVKGNTVYSPDTCVFVPHGINTLFVSCNGNRGDYPVGVSYDKERKKYRAELNIDKRNIHLHRWDTPEEAFAEYKKHKEALILVTADKYKGKIPNKVYDAMVNWEIEITD